MHINSTNFLLFYTLYFIQVLSSCAKMCMIQLLLSVYLAKCYQIHVWIKVCNNCIFSATCNEFHIFLLNQSFIDFIILVNHKLYLSSFI